MKIPDLNVVLYAVDSTSARHEPSRAWLEEQLSGRETTGFAWAVLVGFVRLATNPRVFAVPLAPTEAFDAARGWLAQPNAVAIEPTDRHLDVMAELLAPLGTAGNLTTDAHLAALAIEHGGEIVTFDADFGRFPGVRRHEPGV